MNRNYLKSFLIGLTLALLLIFAGEVSATDLYVNPGDSIQGAINDATPGDTIVVAEGTYYENVTVSKAVTLISEKKHKAEVVGSTPGQDVILITAAGAIVKGFHVRNAGMHDGIAVKANEVTVRENKVTGSGPFTGWVTAEGAGISVILCDHVMVIKNDICYTSGAGIWIGNATNSLFIENKVEYTQYTGILLGPWAGIGCHHNLIAKNKIKKCGTEWNYDDGIRLGALAYNNIVWDNDVHDSSRSGIYAHWNNVHDNTIIGNKMKGHPGPGGGFDAYDRTSDSGTAGTANWWVDNKGETESPVGLLK